MTKTFPTYLLKHRTKKKVIQGEHLLEGQRGFVAVLVAEVVVHAEIRLSAELVAGLAVGDALDHAALRKNRSVTAVKYLQQLAPTQKCK